MREEISKICALTALPKRAICSVKVGQAALELLSLAVAVSKRFLLSAAIQAYRQKLVPYQSASPPPSQPTNLPIFTGLKAMRAFFAVLARLLLQTDATSESKLLPAALLNRS